jgi:hypothetical protein
MQQRPSPVITNSPVSAPEPYNVPPRITGKGIPPPGQIWNWDDIPETAPVQAPAQAHVQAPGSGPLRTSEIKMPTDYDQKFADAVKNLEENTKTTKVRVTGMNISQDYRLKELQIIYGQYCVPLLYRVFCSMKTNILKWKSDKQKRSFDECFRRLEKNIEKNMILVSDNSRFPKASLLFFRNKSIFLYDTDYYTDNDYINALVSGVRDDLNFDKKTFVNFVCLTRFIYDEQKERPKSSIQRQLFTPSANNTPVQQVVNVGGKPVAQGGSLRSTPQGSAPSSTRSSFEDQGSQNLGSPIWKGRERLGSQGMPYWDVQPKVQSKVQSSKVQSKVPLSEIPLDHSKLQLGETTQISPWLQVTKVTRVSGEQEESQQVLPEPLGNPQTQLTVTPQTSPRAGPQLPPRPTGKQVITRRRTSNEIYGFEEEKASEKQSSQSGWL